MRLTEEGRRYLDSVREALAALAEGEQALKQQNQGLTGSASIGRAIGLWTQCGLGWLDEFKAANTRISACN